MERNDKDASKPVSRHFNLPNHSIQHVAVCGLSLHLGSSESHKTLEQKFIFQIGIPTESTSVFHSTNLFLFSRHHIPTNGVAPLAAYKPTHNPQSSNRSYSKCLLLNVTGKRLRSIAKQQCEIELQFCLNDKVL